MKGNIDENDEMLDKTFEIEKRPNQHCKTIEEFSEESSVVTKGDYIIKRNSDLESSFYENGSVSESFQSVIRTAKKEVHGHTLIPDTLFKNHNCIKSLNQTQLNDLIDHFKEIIGENLISDLIIFEIHS